MERAHKPDFWEIGRLAGIMGYFGLIGWLIAYFVVHRDKKTELGSFQLRQTLLFAMVSVPCFVLTLMIMLKGTPGMGYLSTAIYAVLLIIWVIGFIGALRGEQIPMPLIGAGAQKMFRNI